MLSLWLKKMLIGSGAARLLPGSGRPAGADRCLHYYSDLVLSTPLHGLAEAHSWLEAGEPDGIDLAAGAPQFDLVPSLHTKLPADRRGYPPAAGLVELRRAVAEALHADHGVRADPDGEVLVTHGAAGAFAAAVDAFVNRGDKVVLFAPTSPLYPLVLRQRRAGVAWVPAAVADGRLTFCEAELARALNRAKLLVLACPNNPDGGVLAPEDLERIAWWADHHDALVIDDRTFARFCYGGRVPGLASLPKAEGRTLTVGSVSKSHALASARVGWLAGPGPLVGACAAVAVLQAPFVATVSQQLAVAALRADRGQLDAVVAGFASRRQYTFDRLRSMGLAPAWPGGTFFAWVPVGHLGATGREFAAELRERWHVAVCPGELFGPGGSGHVRLSYAGDEGRLREGLGRIAEFVGQKQSQREIATASQPPREAA